MSNLSPADRKLVQQQLLSLTPRIKAAQEKEVGDMMGKLKDVCHDCLSMIWIDLCTDLWDFLFLARQWHLEAFRAVDG
jgi:hypothetical protein